MSKQQSLPSLEAVGSMEQSRDPISPNLDGKPQPLKSLRHFFKEFEVLDIDQQIHAYVLPRTDFHQARFYLAG